MKPRQPGFQRERGARQEAKILDLLAQKPHSRVDLAEALHIAESGVRAYLARMMAPPRMVRVVGYVRSGGRAAFLYGVGNGPDAKFKRAEYRIPKSRSDLSNEIIEALEMPLTSRQVALKVGLSASRTIVYIRKLRGERKVHIGDWIDGRGGPKPVYLAGANPDAPKPPRKSNAEYRQKSQVKRTTWAATLFTQRTSHEQRTVPS